MMMRQESSLGIYQLRANDAIRESSVELLEGVFFPRCRIGLSCDSFRLSL
jgi:hypothetical protein